MLCYIKKLLILRITLFEKINMLMYVCLPSTYVNMSTQRIYVSVDKFSMLKSWFMILCRHEGVIGLSIK